MDYNIVRKNIDVEYAVAEINLQDKVLLVGLGAVGKSFLEILKEQGLFNPELFYCVDCNEEALNVFIQAGGYEEHFILKKIEKNNYLSLLDIVGREGYILDFSVNVKSIDMLNMCIENGIHYLSLADSSWFPDPTWFSAHQHYKEYRKIFKRIKSEKHPTCLIEFGMNPGMISCFLKQCIEDIIENDESDYIKKHREKLKKLLRQKQYNKVAKKIGVKYVIEVDNDNQEFNVEPKNDTVYSPWCPFSFYMETYAAPEIIFGTKKEFLVYKELSDCDYSDLYVSLTQAGMDYREHVFSPQGEVEGFLTTHEEIFSMCHLLQDHRYKPTTYFVYSPSKIAEASAARCRANDIIKCQIMNRDEIIAGGESVGIIVQGERFHSRYFGNYLDNTDLHETATVRQVSASAYAAFRYMLQNTEEGVLMPEDLPHKDLLATAKKYLKEYISVPCKDVKPNLGTSW